jgi:ferredoxin
MPAQVVVVRRSRRGLFAAPRALPDLLRSLGAALRSGARRAAVARDAARPTFPRLARDEAGRHRCIACRRCVDVCPSDCLALESAVPTGEGDAARPVRFELSTGACIGCAECLAICPESALEMGSSAAAVPAAASAEPRFRDLLAAVE